ncbi:MAG TPA: hypothetical protein VHR40_11290 [Thermoleophilaceae bacterium]|nr:hypothetical protein [Thermoleophilaceae bacterium]
MRRAALAALAATLVLASSAHADNWVLTGASSIPNQYWQGLTSDRADKRVFFVGVFEGLWRTTPSLRQTAGVGNVIPPGVTATEGYNHIGDPTWNPGDGGRVLLPLECYTPGVGNGNTCGTGSFGVADPATLAWRYYVQLDPAQIPKAMWAETSPDGKLVWTSSGDDLLAYRSSDITAANAGPGAPPIRAARRLRKAVPPSGVTGAVFVGGRLLLAGTDAGRNQIWSIDTKTGKRRLEVQQRFCGESEGLDTISTLGGTLHWLVGPSGEDGCKLTYGPTSALLHFVSSPGKAGLRVGASRHGSKVAVRVTRKGAPVAGARVTFASAHARTNAHGRATLKVKLVLPGRFKALAVAGSRYGVSKLISAG